jgi:transporter family protein
MQTIFFLPSALCLGYWTGTLHFGLPYMYGMCAGVTLYFALFYFSISLSKGDVSVVAPVFRSSFVLSALLAIIFLNEALTISKSIAFLLLVIAAFLLLSNIQTNLNQPSDKRSMKGTLRTLTIATLLMGITGFIYKLGAMAGGNSISIVNGQAIVFFPLAFLSCYHKEKKIIILWKFIYLGFAAALFLFGGMYLLLEALKIGPASTIVPISQMSFVVTAIFGFLIFKENFSIRKITGLALTICAIWLLSQ